MSRTATRTAAVVEAAGYREGYTATHHLLNHSVFDTMIGRVYPSEAAARAEADRLGVESPPTYVTTHLIDAVPAAHIDAAVLRAARQGWGIVDGRDGGQLKPSTDNAGYLCVTVQADYSPRRELTAGAKVDVRIYRP